MDVGKVNSGAFDNIHAEDGSLLILDEENETPGFRYDFNWVIIPDSSASNMFVLTIIGEYNGDDDHDVKLQIFDYDTTAFEYVTANAQDLPNVLEQATFQFNLATHTNNYIENGAMIIRIIHETAGNDGHLLRIDEMFIGVGSSSSSSSSRSSSSSSSSSKSSTSESFSSSSRSLGFES